MSIQVRPSYGSIVRHSRDLLFQITGVPPPTGGIGVLAVVLTIANGIFQLTGKRLRHLLMSAESVKVVLLPIFKERRQKL